MPKNKVSDNIGASSITRRLAGRIAKGLYGGSPDDAKRPLGAFAMGGVFAGGVGRVFSEIVEESALYRFFTRFADSMLKRRLRVYGVFLLTFGLYTAVINLVLALLAGENRSLFQLFCGVCLAVSSFPLLSSGATLSHALRHSDLGKFLISVSGIRTESLNKRGTDGRCGGAFMMGAIAGLLSYFVSPVSITLAVVKIIFIWIVFISPEAALPAILFVYPFVSVKTMILIFIVGMASFALKLLRGKRFVNITSTDAAVLLLAVITVVASAALGSGAFFGGLRFAAALCGYFFSTLLLKRRRWIYTSVCAFLTSTIAVASCVIFQTASGAFGIGGDILSLVSAEGSVLRMGISAFAPCFAISLTLAVGMLCDPLENVRRRTALAAAASSVLVLLICGRGDVLSAALLGAVTVILVRSRRNIYAVISLVLLCLTAAIWIPRLTDRIFGVGTSIADMLIACGLPLGGKVGNEPMLADTLISAVFPFGEILLAVVVITVMAMAITFSVKCYSAQDRSLSFGEISDGDHEIDADGRRRVLISLRIGAVVSAVGAVSYMLISGGAAVWNGGTEGFIMWTILGLTPSFVSSAAEEISLGSYSVTEKNDSIAASMELMRSTVGESAERTARNGKKKV